jgi:DNA-binding NtrC family response regulator
MNKILVVDDELMIRQAFAAFLKDEGHTALLAEDGEKAFEQILANKPDIIFLDYRLPGRDGLDLLSEIKKMDSSIAVVFMTAFGAMDVAIKAMQYGAYEYLTKPLDLDKVREIINRILEGRNFLKEKDRFRAISGSQVSLEKIIGTSPAMQDLYKMIGLLTTQDVTVLVTGESGVGKELVARAIHDNSSRKEQPFVALNCGAIPENLLESELFGHEQGAFTGAHARKLGKFEITDQGTLFLDEIGELQPALQVKFLRAIQDQNFNRVGGNEPVQTHARVIAATNKNLYEEMISGRFRKDLFYRLNLMHITIPPLRERLEDIPLLVDHFIRQANQKQNRQVQGVADSVIQEFDVYPWPGNVRELENLIGRAMVLCRGDILTSDFFELDFPHITFFEQDASANLIDATRKLFANLAQSKDFSLLMTHIIGIVEKTIVEEAMETCNDNQVHAAEILGIHRSTLRKKLKEYGS